MEVEVEVQFGLKRSALPEELLGLFDGRVALPKGTVSVPSIPQRSILLTFAGFGLGLLVAGLLSLQSYFSTIPRPPRIRREPTSFSPASSSPVHS